MNHVDSRIDDVQKEMHQGFSELRGKMDQGFDELKTLFFKEKIKELDDH